MRRRGHECRGARGGEGWGRGEVLSIRGAVSCLWFLGVLLFEDQFEEAGEVRKEEEREKEGGGGAVSGILMFTPQRAY